jgi:hypothetical protein
MQPRRAYNALGITEPLPTEVSAFHSSPHQVIQSDRFWQAIEQHITAIRSANCPPCRSTSQWVDSTDVQTYPHWFERLRGAYGGWR